MAKQLLWTAVFVLGVLLLLSQAMRQKRDAAPTAREQARAEAAEMYREQIRREQREAELVALMPELTELRQVVEAPDWAERVADPYTGWEVNPFRCSSANRLVGEAMALNHILGNENQVRFWERILGIAYLHDLVYCDAMMPPMRYADAYKLLRRAGEDTLAREAAAKQARLLRPVCEDGLSVVPGTPPPTRAEQVMACGEGADWRRLAAPH